jgi:cell division inhibitor SepF
MVGIFKNISEKLSNKMMAPGAEESDGYYYDEYDEDYDDYEEYDDEPEIEVRYSRQEKSSNRKSNAKSAPARPASRGGRDNVYSLTPNASGLHKQPQSESVIMHPKQMEDAVEIGNHIRSGRMCIVDLTGVPTAEAQRVADYLCGTCNALDGAITRVNKTILAVSPPSHRVMPDYREDTSFDAGFLKKAANSK